MTDDTRVGRRAPGVRDWPPTAEYHFHAATPQAAQALLDLGSAASFERLRDDAKNDHVNGAASWISHRPTATSIGGAIAPLNHSNRDFTPDASASREILRTPLAHIVPDVNTKAIPDETYADLTSWLGQSRSGDDFSWLFQSPALQNDPFDDWIHWPGAIDAGAV